MQAKKITYPGKILGPDTLCEKTWPYGNTLDDAYEFYCDAMKTSRVSGTLPKKKFNNLVRTFSRLLATELLQGKVLTLPGNLGLMYIIQMPMDKRIVKGQRMNRTVFDINKTLEMRKETGDDSINLFFTLKPYFLSLKWLCPKFTRWGRLNVPYKFNPGHFLKSGIKKVVYSAAIGEPSPFGCDLENFQEHFSIFELQKKRKIFVRDGFYYKHKRTGRKGRKASDAGKDTV